jgi:hypothetical protein
MYLNIFLQLKSLAYCIWEILPFYKILVKPWDVDRGKCEKRKELWVENDKVDV